MFLQSGRVYFITNGFEGFGNVLGKKIGQDLAEGKTTLPLIYLLQNGSPVERELVSKAILSGGEEYLTDIQIAIQESKALDYTIAMAHQQIEKAKIALCELPETPFREGLLKLADFIIQRHY